MRIINMIMTCIGYFMVCTLVCSLVYFGIADLKDKRKHRRQTQDSRWTDLLNRVDILEKRMDAVEFGDNDDRVIAEFYQEVKADE